MSRKWERMIEKNRKQLNERRKKQGMGEVTAGGMINVFKGRSYILPLFLLSVAALFGYVNIRAGMTDTLFWITISSYLLLSIYFFFVRRPYFKIAGSEIAMRKMGRERRAKLSDIQKISVNRGTVIISIQGEKMEWFFSKGLQQFRTKEMAEALEAIAEKRKIPFDRS